MPEAVEERVGVAAAGEQDVVVADEEDVHVDQVSVSHGSSPVAHAAWNPMQLTRHVTLGVHSVADCPVRVVHVADPDLDRGR
ncbi:hypothetical protein GCM10018963_15170 [Saccharothrix longispora]